MMTTDTNTATTTKYIEQLVSMSVCVCSLALCESVHRVYMLCRGSSSRVYFYHCELTKKKMKNRKTRSHLGELDAIFIYFRIREHEYEFSL